MSRFFFNPWMLSALAAVSIPLIIEWLFRWRKRRVVLPTLRYLLNNQEEEKIRRQDRILLILRMVGIFLLVMALTRPLVQRGWVGAARQRQVVVLLDGTASMNQQVDMTTSFGRAQEVAAGMIRSLPAGARVTVGYLGERAGEAVEWTDDRYTAAAQVKSLRAGAGDAPMSEGLEWVKAALDRQQVRQAELYVFSDFQRQTWQPARRQEVVYRVLTELKDRCETFMVDCGGAGEFNYLLTGLRPEEPLVSVGVPAKFLVTVESRGTVPLGRQARVTFIVDGVKKDVQEARPTDQPVTLTFQHRFPGPGEYLVEAELEGDEHRIDNRRMYLCSVPEAVRVLILDEQAGSPSADSLFLARATAPPTRPGVDKVSNFTANVVSPAQISYENLDSYGVVVLTAMHNLAESVVSKLERYVADGGALWVFMGPSANQYEYNKLLFKDGQGLLPVRLAGRQAATQPDPKDGAGVFPRFGHSTHPALAHLVDQGGSQDASVVQYVSADGSLADSAVVLGMSNGSPLMVEKAFGRGRVLWCGTTAGPEWTYLPAVQEYIVLVQEMLRYLVGSPDRAVNLDVGARFEQPVFVSAQHLLLRCPDGRKERLTPQKRPGREDAWMVSFDGTNHHGLYEIEAIEEVLPRRRFVVNQSEREGDLSRLTEGQFDKAFSAARWSWVRPEMSLKDMVARLHTVIELAPGFLWVLVGVLAVESFLAWRFGRRRGEIPS